MHRPSLLRGGKQSVIRYQNVIGLGREEIDTDDGEDRLEKDEDSKHCDGLEATGDYATIARWGMDWCWGTETSAAEEDESHGVMSGSAGRCVSVFLSLCVWWAAPPHNNSGPCLLIGQQRAGSSLHFLLVCVVRQPCGISEPMTG